MSKTEDDLPAPASEDELVLREGGVLEHALDVSNRGLEILRARLEQMTTREVTAAVKESAKIAAQKRQWSQRAGEPVGQGGRLLAETLARMAKSNRVVTLKVEPPPWEEAVDVTPVEPSLEEGD